MSSTRRALTAILLLAVLTPSAQAAGESANLDPSTWRDDYDTYMRRQLLDCNEAELPPAPTVR